MKCESFPEETYGLYSLGSLSGSDADAIRDHLTLRCATCEEHLRDFRILWTAVGSATAQATPRRGVRRRLLQSIGGGVAWWRHPATALAAMAMFVFGGIGIWMVMGWQKTVPAILFSPEYRVALPGATELPAAPIVVNRGTEPVQDPEQARAIAGLKDELAREQDQRTQAEAELARQRSLVETARQAAQEAERKYTAAAQQQAAGEDAQRKLAEALARVQELERRVSTYRALLDTQRARLEQDLQLATLVRDPRLRVFQLRPTEKGKAAGGHALIAGNERMIFFANDLPALPAGRVYQLWLLRSNGLAVASGGVFSADPARRASFQIRDPALLTGVNALAVTDEPAGGSAQPTGHKWLVGS